MSSLNIALAVVGFVVLLLGFLTRPVTRSLVSAPLLSFLAGTLSGPEVLGWLDPAGWGDSHKLLEEATRLTLGISLMGIALRLPARYPFRHWRPLAVLLLIVMPAMCVISALLAGWLIGLPLLVALLVGSSVCPTDPVVSSSIVTGGLAKEALPERFRHMLSTEAGINDGLAYPLVMLPVLLLTLPSDKAWTEWFLQTWLWEIGGSIACGALLGMLAGRALLWVERHGLIDQPSFLSTTIALTLLTLGLGKLIGTDSVLAVFVAGLCFDQCIGGKERAENNNVQETVNQFFTLPVFILFGLMAPWGAWSALGWYGISLGVAILLLRR
ncbi:cation:proton antiporter [Chromohalobacter canadensis]|uniref:cation:proton antiporter domain-containing protein n=1 Tax=Chromohalobacter canadensis TaxID=141389 RepID=UPI00241046F4|nr:cation:proton antiporter [Chromohalobacter canadensis]